MWLRRLGRRIAARLSRGKTQRRAEIRASALRMDLLTQELRSIRKAIEAADRSNTKAIERVAVSVADKNHPGIAAIVNGAAAAGHRRGVR